MLALAKPNIQFPKTKLFVSKKHIHPQRVQRRVHAALPDPDLVNYSLFQLTSWVMPMTIAGRLLKMEYNEIGVGLVAIGVTKTLLEAGDIIHY